MDRSMDEAVTTVLEAYHARMQEEVGTRQAASQAGLKDALRDQFLLSVGPESGQLINILARSLKVPNILELGTSYGYSTIWLAEAARSTGGRLTTMELHGYKAAHARDMAGQAGLAEHVDFKIGDAVQMITELPHGIDFVLIDLWKEFYVPCLEAFYPKLNPGAIIVADNIIRPGKDGALRYVETVRAKPGMSSILLPVGAGLEVSRFDKP
jgi:predicted O-methyltransferase YrrM